MASRRRDIVSLRENILKANDIQEEIVEVPEWGVKVLVRGLTGEARAKLLSKATDVSRKIDYAQLYASLVILSTFDPDTKEQVFEETDRDELMKKSATAIERITTVAMRLSGVGKIEEEKIEKN